MRCKILTEAIPYFAFIFLIFFSLNTVSAAYEHQHPPYKKGKMPQACQIHPIKASISQKGNLQTFTVQDAQRRLTLTLKKIIDRRAYGLFAALKMKKGKKQKYVQNFSWVGLSPKYLDKVYWAYLNQDNKKDLIINTRFASIGHLNGFQVSTFYLSTPKGYSVKQLLSYKLEPADFLDYTNDKKCEYLHLSYVYGTEEAGKRAKKYNYWSYNILAFTGEKIRLHNRSSRYFPKWITDVGRYSDKPTKWLPKKKQQKLWNRHQEDLGGLVAVPDTLKACQKMPNRYSGC